MKSAAILILVLALGAGLMVFTLAGRPAAQAETSGQAGAGPGAGLDRLEGELDELRGALEALTARIGKLELSEPTALAPSGDQRVAAAAVTPAELAEIRAMVEAIKDPTSATGVPFETMVLGVIENRELQEQAERDQRRADAAADRIEQRVVELAEELGLSSFQSGELLSILTEEQTERDTFFDEMRSSGTFDRSAIRDGMDELRTKTQAALGQVLSPEQLERYLETSQGGFGGGDGGRGPGGRGGPPGR